MKQLELNLWPERTIQNREQFKQFHRELRLERRRLYL